MAVALALFTVTFVGCAGGGDDDGLPADTEASGWSVHVTYPNRTQQTYNVTSDPTETDTDGDGVNDFRELQQGSDPRNIDTDEDGLADGATLCPEEGSTLEERIHERDIVAHPSKEGCYLGETRTELDAFTYRTSPVDAHTDSSPQLHDHLHDGEELRGWTITMEDGTSSDVRSNPALGRADSDGDGLHDGLERHLGTDPLAEDSDGDGVNDLNDAVPLGNLQVAVHVASVNLKQDFRIGGGADLIVEVGQGDLTETRGPERIDKGKNQIDWTFDLDVSDEGSDLTEAMGGAYASGNWQKELRLQFLHDSGQDGEPIEVRSQGSAPSLLLLEYDAFAERWDGHARGGTSSGPDADVTIDVSTTIE